MTVVSSKEFVSNQEKYFDLALNEQVFIQKEDYMFIFARITDNKREHKISDSRNTTKLSDKFRGVFSKEIGDDFMKHTKAMREEWNSI